MNIITTGWSYISAIFQMLVDSVSDKENQISILEPQYIFRGITMRHFSSSEKIKEYIENTHMSSNKKSRKNPEEQVYKREYASIIKEFSPLKCNKNYPDSLSMLKAFAKKLELIAPEYIRSGAAIRLKNLQFRTYNDTINYLISLISDAKQRFPDEYRDMSDISILADLQHKGGATCMVDFSNNFLISLWFAVQNDFDEIGYLFCYDIHKEMIEKDSLSKLGPRNELKSIKDLLYDTTKSTNYNGKNSYKFWLWKPSNLNARISRQDSVFLFGLEPFKIKDHNMIVIPIPPHWKRPILLTLKNFFGISAESVYCDDYGFAVSNGKLSNYNKTMFNIVSDELYTESQKVYFAGLQNGIACLLDDKHQEALKFLTQFESYLDDKTIDLNITTDSMELLTTQFVNTAIQIELYFSKALCYKHLCQSKSAIVEYEKALALCVDALNVDEDNEYFINKLYKILNDLIDLLYDSDDFSRINYIINNVIMQFLNNDGKISEFIQTMTNEIKLLMMFQNKEFDSEQIDCCDSESSLPFYRMLNYFFKLMAMIGNNEEYAKLECAYNEVVTIATFYDYYNVQVCTKWNLEDVEKKIDVFKSINPELYNKFISEVNNLRRALEYIESRKLVPQY